MAMLKALEAWGCFARSSGRYHVPTHGSNTTCYKQLLPFKGIMLGFCRVIIKGLLGFI